MHPTVPTLSIRLATLADAPAINEIFNHYVLHTTTTFATAPTSLAEREQWLAQRAEPHPATVAELEGRVVAFGAISAFRTRAAYAQTVELSLNVHWDFHRRGLGRAMLADLIARARALGHHALVGGCCAENTASVELLQTFGFRTVGHFPEVGRKFDRWLDVTFLQLLV